MNRDELITPCFILDEDDVSRNLKNFREILNRYFDDAIIGYSFKTNSISRVLYLAMENGCYAEVVSDDEYRLAKRIGFVDNKIIFNGPVKGKEMFLQALRKGSLINIDSQREIDWILEQRVNSTMNIGIRVNFDLEKQLPGQTLTENRGGRFGFCYENGELHTAIKRLRENHSVNITRLHMHVSNLSKSVDVYCCLAKMACRIIEEEELNISSIDFGGGYFGGGDNGEYYEKYISKIYKTLKQYGYEKLEVIVEPGASIIATAFSYLTTVVDVKCTSYGVFIVTDGTRLHIDPFMRKIKQCYFINSKNHETKEKQVICGYTCMENDTIMTINDFKLQVGDTICYKVVGSYTMCFNSLFITYFPRVYSTLSKGEYINIREKWGIDEYMQGSRWIF